MIGFRYPNCLKNGQEKWQQLTFDIGNPLGGELVHFKILSLEGTEFQAEDDSYSTADHFTFANPIYILG
jgi:hypothetical protein